MLTLSSDTKVEDLDCMSRGEGIVGFGTYDLVKPRYRILIEAIRGLNVPFQQVHLAIWGFRDRSRYPLPFMGLLFALSVLASVGLAIRYLFTKPHKFVFVGYPGLWDLFVIVPLARLRGARVVFDNFLPWGEMLIADRKRVSAHGMLARVIRFVEGRACHLADVVMVDTEAHGRYLTETYGIPAPKIKVVYVGAERSFLVPSTVERNAPLRVLFYAQIGPLHGFETIVSAALSLRDRTDIEWTFIGADPESSVMMDLRAALPPGAFRCYSWVEPEELPGMLAACDLTLGVFGNSPKAQRVVPNKMYQALSAGKIVVTADSAAVRECNVSVMRSRVDKIPSRTPEALAERIVWYAQRKREGESFQAEPFDFMPVVTAQLREVFR